MTNNKIIADYIGLHTNVANVLSGHTEAKVAKTESREFAYWTLRMALQKKAIVFQQRKFVVLVPDTDGEYAQLIFILERLKIDFTTFV